MVMMTTMLKKREIREASTGTAGILFFDHQAWLNGLIGKLPPQSVCAMNTYLIA